MNLSSGICQTVNNCSSFSWLCNMRNYLDSMGISCTWQYSCVDVTLIRKILLWTHTHSFNKCRVEDIPWDYAVVHESNKWLQSVRKTLSSAVTSETVAEHTLGHVFTKRCTPKVLNLCFMKHEPGCVKLIPRLCREDTRTWSYNAR